MANKDVTVTIAGAFNGPALNRKQQKAIEVLAKWFQANSTGTAPTVAQINTDLAAANACIIPQSPIQFSAIRAALWWKAALNNVAPPHTATSDILADAKVFYSMDDEALERLDFYLTGKFLSVLT